MSFDTFVFLKYASFLKVQHICPNGNVLGSVNVLHQLAIEKRDNISVQPQSIIVNVLLDKQYFETVMAVVII